MMINNKSKIKKKGLKILPDILSNRLSEISSLEVVDHEVVLIIN